MLYWQRRRYVIQDHRQPPVLPNTNILGCSRPLIPFRAVSNLAYRPLVTKMDAQSRFGHALAFSKCSRPVAGVTTKHGNRSGQNSSEAFQTTSIETASPQMRRFPGFPVCASSLPGEHIGGVAWNPPKRLEGLTMRRHSHVSNFDRSLGRTE